MQELTNLHKWELKEIEQLNKEFAGFSFEIIFAEIKKIKIKAPKQELLLLENWEKVILLLQKIGIESHQLAIEKQPDYQQVMLGILEQDAAKKGKLVSGKKAFANFFKNARRMQLFI